MIDIKNLVRPNISRLKPYASARKEYAGKEGIFLDANENPFGSLNRYPDPLQIELKKKLAAIKNVSIDQIFVGNGSDEVIDLAFRIFCNPGTDKALTFPPTYGMYEISSEINNIKLIKLDLNDVFQIDIEKTLPYLGDDKIKLIFICSPNNPTGNLINEKDIRYILNHFNGIVIIDEAYIEFAKAESKIELINQFNNLIICQTFSKAWGLAAARVGTAYANPEIISLLTKIKSPYNISQLNQNAVITALGNRSQYENNLASIQSEIERLNEALQQVDTIKKVYPSEANFFLVEVDDADYLHAALLKKSIITRNRSQYVKNCIRITVGTPAENDKLIKALR